MASKKGMKRGIDRVREALRNAEPGDLRRKNYELDQEAIDLVKEVLGARSETEAITRALALVLDMASFREEVRSGAEAMYAHGGFEHVYDEISALDFSGFERYEPAVPDGSTRGAVAKGVSGRRARALRST